MKNNKNFHINKAMIEDILINNYTESANIYRI